MSKVKKWLVGSISIVFLLLISFWYFFIYFPEPKGFVLLREAKEAMQNEEYRMANFILEDARENGFGTCALSYWESHAEIDSLYVSNLFMLQEFKEIRHYISSPAYLGNYHDYFLIKSLLLEFGNDTVETAFKKGMNLIRFEPEKITPEFAIIEDSEVVYGFVPLVGLNTVLKLEATYTGVQLDFEGDYSEEMNRRVKAFMALSKEEQIEYFKLSWLFKVLDGQEEISSTPHT